MTGRFLNLLAPISDPLERRSSAAATAVERPLLKLATALLAILFPAPALADTLIDNVDGLTLTSEGKVRRFTGLVIGDDGRVKALLDRTDKRPARPDYAYNAKGRVMMPGLIDAHGHVMGLGLQAIQLDLSATRSLAEAQAAIKAYADANPRLRWILGSGWNQEQWGLGRFPTAAEIDQVVGDRPVLLERIDGHASWANSAALKAAGVTAATRAPAGGRIEKLANGQPSGVLVDAAADLVKAKVPPMLPRERDLAFAKAQERLAGFGITAIADMGTSVDDWLTFRRAGDAGRLNLRIFSYAAGVEPLFAIAGGGPTPWLYDDRLRMAGVKLYLDGALGSRGALLKAPYADRPGETGLGFLTDSQLRNLMSRAAMDGFQLAVHAIGDAANAQLLSAIEELAETYQGDRRWRIEHAQIVDPADIARFGRHGIIASMQPVHQTSDRVMAEARMGPARLGGAYAWASIANAGARLAFGSDTPVESPDPFAGLAVAMTREDAGGQPPGGWLPAEKVTREAALAGFTTGAAHASFAETRIGILEPGMHADFILVDRDPMLVTPGELRATVVHETWLGGRRVFERKEAPTP